jgi:hypothetical protein
MCPAKHFYILLSQMAFLLLQIPFQMPLLLKNSVAVIQLLNAH